MSIKNQRGRFQNNLMNANQEIARLAAACQQLEQQKSQLVNILCAILMKEHKGAIDLGPDDIRTTQGMFINCKSLNTMGLMRVSVKMPGSDKIQVPGENGQTPEVASTPGPQLVPTQPAPEPEPEREPLTCSEPWHADPDAIGIRCAACGDERKLAPAMA